MSETFLITEDATKSNLDVLVAKPSIYMEVDLPGHKDMQRTLECDGDGNGVNVGIPYMTNPKAIKKHTCLIANHEAELSKVAAKEASEKKAQAKKAAKEVEEANKKKQDAKKDNASAQHGATPKPGATSKKGV